MQSRLAQIVFFSVAVSMIVLDLGARLVAAGPTVVPTPEIDGGSVGVGLALLAAGVLTLRALSRERER